MLLIEQLLLAPEKQIVVKRFTVSQSWIVPDGVTTLRRVEGRGSAGIADSWSGFTPRSYFTETAGITPASAHDSYFDQFLSPIFNGSTADRIVNTTDYRKTYTEGAKTITLTGDGFNISSAFRVRGGPIQRASYSASSSSGVSYRSYLGANLELFNSGSNGIAATGFGYTFPGGTKLNPTALVQRYENVSVSPGNSISISIQQGAGYGAYIEIEYEKT